MLDLTKPLMWKNAEHWILEYLNIDSLHIVKYRHNINSHISYSVVIDPTTGRVLTNTQGHPMEIDTFIVNRPEETKDHLIIFMHNGSTKYEIDSVGLVTKTKAEDTVDNFKGRGDFKKLQAIKVDI